MHVSLAYDPLLAKVIATAPTREQARQLLLRALRESVVLGAVTNTALLQHALALPDFVAATHDTKTLEANLLDESAVEPTAAIIAAARRAQRPGSALATDPFAQLGQWRQPGLATSAPSGDDGESVGAHVHVIERGDSLWVSVDGVPYELPRSTVAAAAASGAVDSKADHASLLAPMPGSVLQVVEAGTHVAAGDAVVVIEAMKMETTLAAPFDGRVLSTPFAVGDLVTKGAVLAEVGR
jgi:acetyl/propionyl-CoA carboxylase alpha subunit